MEGDANRPRGTTLVDYLCPQCRLSSSAPFQGIVAGKSRIWCCEHCEATFRIVLRLLPLDAASQDAVSQSTGATDDEQEGRQRLLELCGERLFLLDRLEELNHLIDELDD